MIVWPPGRTRHGPPGWTSPGPHLRVGAWEELWPVLGELLAQAASGPFGPEGGQGAHSALVADGSKSRWLLQPNPRLCASGDLSLRPKSKATMDLGPHSGQQLLQRLLPKLLTMIRKEVTSQYT